MAYGRVTEPGEHQREFPAAAAGWSFQSDRGGSLPRNPVASSEKPPRNVVAGLRFLTVRPHL